MAAFVRIEPIETREEADDRGPDDRGTRDRGARDRNGAVKTLNISIDVGKTLALMLFGLLVLVGALILYLDEKDTAAAAFFALGEAIVVSGFGVVYGESSGASEAARKLS
jgi:hypothetical protein